MYYRDYQYFNQHKLRNELKLKLSNSTASHDKSLEELLNKQTLVKKKILKSVYAPRTLRKTIMRRSQLDAQVST